MIFFRNFSIDASKKSFLKIYHKFLQNLFNDFFPRFTTMICLRNRSKYFFKKSYRDSLGTSSTFFFRFFMDFLIKSVLDCSRNLFKDYFGQSSRSNQKLLQQILYNSEIKISFRNLSKGFIQGIYKDSLINDSKFSSENLTGILYDIPSEIVRVC